MTMDNFYRLMGAANATRKVGRPTGFQKSPDMDFLMAFSKANVRRGRKPGTKVKLTSFEATVDNFTEKVKKANTKRGRKPQPIMVPCGQVDISHNKKGGKYVL